MNKRFLAMLLTVLLLVGLLPITALAADTVQVTVNAGGRIVSDAGGNYPEGVTINSDENYELASGKQYKFSGSSPVIRTVYNEGTILSGDFTGVYNLGTIVDGTFHSDNGGTVDNRGTITGGTFKGLVTNRIGGTITGGTFEAGILNYGGTVPSGVKHANVGGLPITTEVWGTGAITVQQNGIALGNGIGGAAGQTYEIAYSEKPVGLYVLTAGDPQPSAPYEISGEINAVLGGVMYTLTMPNEAVTILAVFDDYEAPAATYTVTCQTSENGSVTADEATAAAGDTVTLTFAPADGYELGLVSVMANGSNVTTTAVVNNQCTFAMPAGDVTVSATFSPKSTEPATGCDLWVGGEEVTSENLSGGGWVFEPNTRTLTLTGDPINGNIRSGRYLNIVFSGDITVNGWISASNFTDTHYALSISGTGSLTATTGSLNGAIMAGSITLGEGLQITAPEGGRICEANGAAYIEDSNGAPAQSVTLESSTPADTTAPALSDGKAERTSETEATVSFTSDEAGTYYYLVASEGDGAPLNVGMLIQAAEYQNKTGSSTAGVNTISLTGLAANAKAVYLAVEDAAENASEMLAIDIPAYVPAPELTAGEASRTSDSEATVKFTSSQAGTYAYTVVPSGSAAVGTVKYGDCAAGENTITLTNLTVGAMDVSIRVTNENGKNSDWLAITVPAYEAALTIPYLDANGVQQTCTNPTKYTGQTTLSAGWYYVDGTVSTSSRINVSGDVHLILCDGATLTASGGVGVSSGRSLTIYGQTNGTGTLNATTGTYGVSGIGGNQNQAAGTITINGGIVTARGGSNGAGIGGGQLKAAGTVIINGGAVTATGGSNGAGIGDGAGGHSTAVIINGGTVTANGGSNGAGIGHGNSGSGALTIKINGGSVKAGITSNTLNPQNDAAARVYRNEVTLPAGRTVSEIQILNAEGTEYAYGRRDMQPDANGKLYLWLPEGVTVSAPTEPVKYTITASASDDSLGSVTGGGTYVHGGSVTLAATPAEGYRLAGWKEDDTQVSTDNPYTFTANADRSLVAVFELAEYEVTASADPAEGGTASGGGTYKHGDTATLTASANTGYQFVGWQENGQQVSTDTTYTFAVESDRSLVAVFWKVTYGVDIAADPVAGGSVSGGGTYEHGASVTVTAAPAEGYCFVRWTENGNTASTAASYTFTAEAARSLVAEFTERVVFTSPTTDQVVTATAGQSATFETTAENANFYEWYVDKGDGNGFVIIDDTDSSSYTTPPVTLENDGWVYRCKGVNDASFVNSPTFTLRVAPAEPEHILGGWDCDSKRHWRACSCDELHDYGPHSFGSWKVTKAATTAADGSKERSCTVCGYTETAAIQAAVIPQAGDDSRTGLWASLMGAALAGMLAVQLPRRRKMAQGKK